MQFNSRIQGNKGENFERGCRLSIGTVYTSRVCLHIVSNNERCFHIVSGHSPAFCFYTFIFIHLFFIYGCFPTVLWFFLVYRFDVRQHANLPCFPIVSLGSLTCIIFIYFHLFIYSFWDAFWWFCHFSRCIGFNHHRHVECQLFYVTQKVPKL